MEGGWELRWMGRSTRMTDVTSSNHKILKKKLPCPFIWLKLLYKPSKTSWWNDNQVAKAWCSPKHHQETKQTLLNGKGVHAHHQKSISGWLALTGKKTTPRSETCSRSYFMPETQSSPTFRFLGVFPKAKGQKKKKKQGWSSSCDTIKSIVIPSPCPTTP